MAGSRRYTSALRRDQVEGTRRRILEAGARLLERDGAATEMTTRKVAAEAAVTEMTVYRHFPNRTLLEEALWRHVNDRQGVTTGFPDRLDALMEKIPSLFASFDAAPAHVMSTITTTSGRALRASQDGARRTAFMAAVAAGAPDLPVSDQRRAAAVLQLFFSGYAWLSLREQWSTAGKDASGAIQWAIRVLVDDLGTRGSAPLHPDAGGG